MLYLGALDQMLKGKILLVIGLYITLGVIAFFNFGMYRYITEKSELKGTVYCDTWKDMDGSIQDSPTEDTTESQNPPSEIETDH